MRRHLALAALSACATLGACGPDAPAGPQALQLSFTFDGSSCMFCTGIDDCSLACSGEIGLTLVDATTNEVLDQHCREFAGSIGMVLRSLPNLLVDAAFDEGLDLGRRVVVELAIFSPRSEEGGCPRVLATLSPPSTASGEAPTYFGRSAPARISEGTLAVELPLGCVVDRDECSTSPEAATIVAHVTDLASGQRPPDAFRELDVRSGRLSAGAPGRFTFAVGTQLILQQLSGREPSWRATVEQPNFDPFCFGTLLTQIGTPQAFPIVSCTGEESTDPRTGAARLSTDGYFIDAPIIDTMFEGLGLEDGLPATGILIGRVTGNGLPVAGAKVEPFSGTANIIYLDESLAPSGGVVTSSSGWFVVVEPPRLGLAGDAFGEAFQASLGGLVGCSRGPLGLVDGKIVVGTINLFDDCDSQP